MSNYRRAFIPSGCRFFTVNLLERRQTLLVGHVAALREALAATRASHGFTIDAIRRPARSSARDLETAVRRLRFFHTLAADQDAVRQGAAETGAAQRRFASRATRAASGS